MHLFLVASLSYQPNSGPGETFGHCRSSSSYSHHQRYLNCIAIMASSAAALAGRTFEEILRTPAPTLSAGVGALIDMAMFWKAAGPTRYFTRSDEFDSQLVSRYSSIYPAVHAERITPTLNSSAADEHLGMILLLDQYPRNAFRGSVKQYQSDSLACKWADVAIRHGLDKKVGEGMKMFMYMPFAHSERIEDQDRAVELGEGLGGQFLEFSKEHREVVRRFGRFCHRNEVMGRETTEEERDWMEKEAPAWAKS